MNNTIVCMGCGKVETDEMHTSLAGWQYLSIWTETKYGWAWVSLCFHSVKCMLKALRTDQVNGVRLDG